MSFLPRIVVFVTGGLLLSASALAQQDGPPQPPPGLIGGPPATSGLPAEPAAPERADIKLQFPGSPVGEVLSYYEALTGKRVLLDPTVQGPINIVVNTFITKSEAIRIIEVALNLNGFSLVPAGGDIIKVLGLNKNVRGAGVPIFSDLAQLPNSKESVSFLIRLRYLDAQEVAGLLQQYIPPTNQTTAGVTALPKSGALLITDTANSVRRLVNMVGQIDQPVAPVTEKFIRLERADATKAVEFLNNVFDIKSAQNGGAGPNGTPTARRPIRRLNDDGTVDISQPAAPILPGQLPLLSGDSIIQGRITLTADVRTNRVHVVTSPVNMPLVEQLIADYDADSPFAEPVIRPLHFVKAKDVLPILVQSLQEPGADNAGNSANGNNPARPTPAPSNRGSASGNSESGTGSGSDSTVGQEELSVEPADTIPEIQTVGNTKIIADPSSNRIILLGGAEAKDKIFQVLDSLDVRKRQIIIRVLIGELSLGNNSEFGLQYLLRHNKDILATQYQTGFINPGGTSTTGTTTTTDPTTGAVTTTNNPTSSSSTSTLSDLATLASGLPTGFAGLAGIVSVTKSFDLIVSALNATNRFKTINAPVLFTQNAEKATIINGEEIAVPTSSLSTASIGSTTQNGASISSNVDFKKVALQLEVLPLINSDREVTLEIVQKLDSLVQGANVQVGGNSIPTIANRELKSTVSMQSGATVVLGGLITQSDSKTDNDVPVLSKIPLLGELFKAKTHDFNRSELIILLHPEVVNTPGQIADATADQERRTYLGGNLEDQLLPNFPVRKAIPVDQPATTTTTTTTTVRARPIVPAAK